MKIALISDIHSNHIALSSTLEDIKKQNIDRIFCLGDSIGYGPDPNKAINILRDPKNKIESIMGNYEESVSLGKKDCGCDYINDFNIKMAKISFEWTIENTSEENKEWMKKLPREIRLEIDGKKILIVHGSPEKINGIVDFNFSDEKINAMMEKADADILFCAHTHLPFHKIVDKKHIVNPGSVGRPRIGSPQAEYAIVNLKSDCDVKFRFIDYDYESCAKEIEDSSMPKNNFADVIRTGYWRF